MRYRGACGENRKVDQGGKKERERKAEAEKNRSVTQIEGEENVSAWRIRLLGGRKWPRRLPFWNSRTRHVNFLLRGKVCYEEADTNEQERKYEVYTSTGLL